MPDFTIEPLIDLNEAENSDLQKIIAAALPDQYPYPSLEEFIRAKTAIAFAAVQNAQRIGFILGQAVAEEAEIITLAIRPESQRRGVGRALVLHLWQAAQLAGCQFLFLEVAASNHAAIALYQSLGFEKITERQNYYRRSHLPRETAQVWKLSKK